jgi:hypothetical protein
MRRRAGVSRGRGLDDPQQVRCRLDAAPAQELGSAFCLDRLAEIETQALQPAETRNLACASVSTPSAMHSMPSSSASVLKNHAVGFRDGAEFQVGVSILRQNHECRSNG